MQTYCICISTLSSLNSIATFFQCAFIKNKTLLLLVKSICMNIASANITLFQCCQIFTPWKEQFIKSFTIWKGLEYTFCVRYRYVLHIRMWDGPYFVFLIMANIMNDSLSTSLLKYYFVTSLTIIYEVVFVMCYTTEIDRFVCSLIGIQNSWKNFVKYHITYP